MFTKTLLMEHGVHIILLCYVLDNQIWSVNDITKQKH